MGAVPSSFLALALFFTAISYFAMAMYDGVALRILGYSIPDGRSLVAGYTATSLGQTLGFGVVIGATVRWRFYREHGVSPAVAGLVTGVVSAGFFLALILLVALCIALGSADFSTLAGVSNGFIQSLASGVLFCSGAVFLMSFVQPRIQLGRFNLALPRFQPLLRISGLAVLDILPAAAALWMLMPPDAALTFTQILPIYAVALGLALVSNTPGGLGVLEFACLLAWPHVPAENLIAALILYRVVFYGIPFLFGMAFLLDHEYGRRSRQPRTATGQQTISDHEAVGYGRALKILSSSHRAEACLALQGDKEFFFSPCGEAFIMYRDRGNARIALSDPIGSVSAWPDLLDAFLADCRTAMRTPAFYKATESFVGCLRSKGLDIHQISKEAVVDPQAFTLEGSPRRQLRRKVNQSRKAGVLIDLHGSGAAPFAALSKVNDAWLSGKNKGRKGFSLGRLEASYVSNFDVLTAQHEGKTIAYVSLWKSGDGSEWSIDLMQSTADAPGGTIQLLISEAIWLARKNGVKRFSLCSVQFCTRPKPKTLVERTMQMFWRRYGPRLGLPGLFRFKDMFGPDWEPVYLATPKTIFPITAGLAINALINQPDQLEPKTR